MDAPKPAGEDPDFEQLVSDYYTPLYRFAYSLAKNESDAGDLTQQAFYIWAQKGSSLRDKSKVKSWLFTTLYREFLRTRRRGNKVASYDTELLEAETPPVPPDVVAQMDANEALETLSEVDEIYRVPLALFYLQDFSYKEIAAALELPIGTVMSRLSRGKAQLRDLMAKKDRRAPRA